MVPIIEALRIVITQLDALNKEPATRCREISIAITYLETSLLWLNESLNRPVDTSEEKYMRSGIFTSKEKE